MSEHGYSSQTLREDRESTRSDATTGSTVSYTIMVDDATFSAKPDELQITVAANSRVPQHCCRPGLH